MTQHTPGPYGIMSVCQNTPASVAVGQAKLKAGPAVLPAIAAESLNGGDDTQTERGLNANVGGNTAWGVTPTMRPAADASVGQGTPTQAAPPGVGALTGSRLEMPHESNSAASQSETDGAVLTVTARFVDSASTQETPEDLTISCLDSQGESTRPPTSSLPVEAATNRKASPTPGPWVPSFSEQHDKVRALNGANDIIGSFIEWLPTQGLWMAQYEGEEPFAVLYPTNRGITSLIAGFFDIDEKAFSDETDMAYRYVRWHNAKAEEGS